MIVKSDGPLRRARAKAAASGSRYSNFGGFLSACEVSPCIPSGMGIQLHPFATEADSEPLLAPLTRRPCVLYTVRVAYVPA